MLQQSVANILPFLLHPRSSFWVHATRVYSLQGQHDSEARYRKAALYAKECRLGACGNEDFDLHLFYRRKNCELTGMLQ